MVELLKKHYAVIILSLMVGFLAALPITRSLYNVGLDEFKGVYPIFNSDKMFYMSLTQDVYEGHWGLGNAYVFEHKNDPYIQPPLAELVLSFLAKVFSLNVPTLFYVLDFILPAIIVIILYAIFLQITGERRIAFGFAFFHALVFLPHYAMPLNPQLSFIPFFLGIYFVARLFIGANLNRRQDIIFSSLAGLMTVILVYMYPFFWSSLFVLFFLASFVFFLIDNYNYRYLKNIFYFITPFVIFLLPYLANLFNASQSPHYIETISRYGLFSSHWPSAYYNIATLLVVGIFIFVSRHAFAEKKHRLFSICLVVSAVLLNWQNVITGKFMQFSSHYQRTTIIFSMIVIALVFPRLLKDSKAVKWKIAAFLLMAIFVFQATQRQYQPTVEWFRANLSRQEMIYLQKYDELFDWLNQNTQSDAVVYSADGNLANMMTIYTHNNSYLPYYGAVNLMSDYEVEDRWLSKTIFDETIDSEYILNVDVWVNKFIDEYQSEQVRRKLFGMVGIDIEARDRRVPLEVSEKFLRRYEEYKKGSPEEQLRRYRLDYVVISEKEKNWQGKKKKIESLSFFKLEKQFDGFYVYSMVN